MTPHLSGGKMELPALCEVAAALGAAALVPLANLVLASATILTALVRLAEAHPAGRGPPRRS